MAQHRPVSHRAEARRRIAEIRRAAARVPVEQGRAGRASRRGRVALMVLLEIADTVGATTFAASYRRLVEAGAGRSVDVVRGAAKTLEAEGWIERSPCRRHATRRSRCEVATTAWTIMMPGGSGTDPALPSSVSITGGGDEYYCGLHDTPLDHDLWRRLGPTALAIYRRLTASGQRSRDIADHPTVRCSARTAKSHLAALRALDLAQFDGQKWRRGCGTLDAAAVRVGVAGAGHRLREQHVEDRANYGNWLARLQAADEWWDRLARARASEQNKPPLSDKDTASMVTPAPTHDHEEEPAPCS